jgi:hypothetical protein
MADSNINYKDIEKVNLTIKTTNIRGKEYAEVNQRIRAFRMLYPEGSITTEIISLENGICVMKASVINEKGEVLGTGHAFEKESASFINKTSYIENCETSAVGRALGMCGIGIDMSIASYEEVANAMAQQEAPQKTQKPIEKAQASKKQEFICKNCGQPVTDAEGHSAESIVANTKKQFNMILCMNCAHEVKKYKDSLSKQEEPVAEQNDGLQLPFPIEE